MKLLFDKATWMLAPDGAYLMLKVNRSDATRFCDEMEQGKTYEADLRRQRKKRSLDANAYAWSLIGHIAAKVQNSPNEVYRQYIPDVGGNYQIVPIPDDMIEEWDKLWCEGHIGRMTDDLGPCRNTPGYHNIRCYKGSSDYDTAQMSRLIDMIVTDCKACGIETLSEREISLLKEGWNGKE